VLRLYARAHERVWLHKTKFLGWLQNLKASNEIAKRGVYWNNVVSNRI